MNKKLRLGIVGCGYLGNIIVDALLNGSLEEYELVGVTSRSLESRAKVANKVPCKDCKSIDELLELKPDYVVEAASGKVVKDIAHKVLYGGSNLVVLSIGAFADEVFYEKTNQIARETNKRIYIASGAIGGFDAMRTAALMSGITSKITSEKGPKSLRGTPVFREELMSSDKKEDVFNGFAKEAIALFPTKVNVAVATALATTGADNTAVTISSIPNMVGDNHKIEVKGEDVQVTVEIYSKTSSIAGWSVVALLKNIVSPIVF